MSIRAGEAASARRCAPRGAARGAVLLVGMLVLLTMTTLAIAAVQSTLLQERMSGNLRQSQLALHAAEAALQAAVGYLDAAPRAPAAETSPLLSPACARAEEQPPETGGACARYERALAEWRGPDAAASTQGTSYTGLPAAGGGTLSPLPQVVVQPRVLIEDQHLAPPDVQAAASGSGTHYYRVTAVGFGGRENAVAIVQTTVARMQGE